MVGEPGIEPGPRAPKARILPLYDTPIPPLIYSKFDLKSNKSPPRSSTDRTTPFQGVDRSSILRGETNN